MKSISEDSADLQSVSLIEYWEFKVVMEQKSGVYIVAYTNNFSHFKYL